LSLSYGYVLGAPPVGKGADRSLWADGWVAGLGLDFPLAPRWRILVDERRDCTQVKGGTLKAWVAGADLEYRKHPEGIGLRIGFAQRQNRLEAEGVSRSRSAWTRVSAELPGLVLPLPGAAGFWAHPFGSDHLTTFTRIEYGHVLSGADLGDTWEAGWSLGLRIHRRE
jgi:hypothetical protein